jgi:hypothetical protein
MTPRNRAALSRGHRRWSEPWYRRYAIWYVDVAERGYSYRPGEQRSLAFTPMLQMLIRASSSLELDRHLKKIPLDLCFCNPMP